LLGPGPRSSLSGRSFALTRFLRRCDYTEEGRARGTPHGRIVPWPLPAWPVTLQKIAGELSLIRLFGLIVLVLAGAVWVEPTVVPDERLLILRLRNTQEVIAEARDRSRSWGASAIEAIRSPETPDVAAGRPEPQNREQHTTEERRKLDRLVEEVTREP
jgi:ribosomal protein L14E/L6E/L27E